jgi:hypothetical protein
MVPVSEYFRAVEHIWLLWLGSAVALAWLGARALGRGRGSNWREVFTREDGAAYSLSFVMTFPFFLLLVCLVVETTLFLVVKIGTVHAAFAGARANIVWRTTPTRAEDVNNRLAKEQAALAKTQQAVVNAMAPFASSNLLHLQGAGIDGPSSPSAQRYYQAYAKYAKGDAAPAFIMAKYRFAAKATQVSVGPPGATAADDITVTVTYHRPFIIPGIGRFIGEPAPWPGARFYTYAISSQVTLQNEAPRNPQQSLGIGYVADPVYLDQSP